MSAVPAYFVDYVPASALREHFPGGVIGGPGVLVPVKGTYFLRLRLDGGSAAHLLLTPHFKEIHQIKLVEDFEGTVIYGVGVARRNGFRVFALTSPSRIVLDVLSN